jgi:multidrug efflux pump subunit AcrA (membrane-fusion protein)
MNTSRTITPLVKLCVLVVIGGGLYAFWHKGVPHHEAQPEKAIETEVSVEVGKISLATLRHYVTAYGTIEPEPGVAGKAPASARITAPVAGIVGEVNCIEGQQVEKGQILFTLNNSRKLDGSLDQTPLKIIAPLSGTVTYVNIKPGEVTDPETPTALVEIVDLNRLIVAANVPSSQLSALKVGQVVEIIPQQNEAHDTFEQTETAVSNTTPAALPGTVALIEDWIDPRTDMGPVDISVPPEARLRPGQFVCVRIITEEHRDCLTVPSRSIVKNENGEWVISLVSGKFAVQQPVKIGFREGDRVQIHSLILQPGDVVVTTGAYGLPAKTKIRILND